MRAPANPIAVSIATVRTYCEAPVQLVLPWSQRSYAWGVEQMEFIIHDVKDRAELNASSYYSLGHVSLARDAGPDEVYLIDGNQRTTSIMILLAVIRDLSRNPPDKDQFEALLWRRATDKEAVAKLAVHPSSATFFARAVLDRGATLVQIEEGADLLETERRILRNRDVAVKRLSALSEADLGRFATYLLDHCWLTCTSVATSDEAWEMLRSEEMRGLSHHQSDVLKTRLISAMPRDQQEEATIVWNRCQERLGRDSMGELLTIIRMIDGKGIAPARRPFDVEIIDLCQLYSDGLRFMNRKFEPRATMLAALKSVDLDAGPRTGVVRRHVRTLSWLEQDYWWTPAVRWMELRGLGDPLTADFFFSLDRTAWLHRLGAPDPTALQRRAQAIARDIGDRRPLHQWPSLAIAPKVVDEALKTLNSRTFGEKAVCALVLRRLSFELSRLDDPERDESLCDLGPVDRLRTTTEHILPRSKPKPGSTWERLFLDMDGMRASAHRLGNLAFLSSADNGLCADRDFAEKRPVFSASEHVLARDAAGFEDWTAEVILERSRRLIALLWRVWKLD